MCPQSHTQTLYQAAQEPSLHVTTAAISCLLPALQQH